MKKFFFIIIVLLGVFSECYAERIGVLPPKIKQVIANSLSCRGTFKQSKTLGDLGIVLDSSGTFSVREGRELVWNVINPVPVKYVITPLSFNVIMAGAEQRYPLGANQEAQAINAAIDSFLKGDYSKLFADFAVDYQDGVVWSARLTPLKAQVAAVLKTVTVRGTAKALTDVVIDYKNSDKINIKIEL